jgi:hypothetical protein
LKIGKDSNFLLNENHLTDKYHAHAVVFESPGCKEMLLELEKKFDVRHSGHSINLKDLDIT